MKEHTNSHRTILCLIQDTCCKAVQVVVSSYKSSIVIESIFCESYNDFFKNGIFQIFKEKNPVEIFALYDNELEEYRSKCVMYFGGKEGNKIYFGKPSSDIYIDDKNLNIYFIQDSLPIKNHRL